jgi:hypothetical protein
MVPAAGDSGTAGMALPAAIMRRGCGAGNRPLAPAGSDNRVAAAGFGCGAVGDA